MKQEKNKVRNIANSSWFGDSIHYWPPDALGLARAMALVETIAVNSEQAGDIYKQIFDAWRKAGIQKAYDEIISEVPDSVKEEWKQKLKYPELTIQNGVNKPYTDYINLVNEPGFENLLPKVTEQILSVSPKKPEHLDDLANLFTLILEFIIAGFNREGDEKRLASLIQTKENIDKMIDMEANLKELCARIVPNLDNCTKQDGKDAYTYLDLKVKATPEGADIKGFLDPSVVSTDSCLLTTGQTSGCLCFYRNISHW